MKERSQRYESYINSFAWYLKRRAALERVDNRCQRCGAKDGLEVHHRTYERLENERETDLMVVCPPCHKIEDASRELATFSRRVQRRQSARVDAWATKKYGEGWEHRFNEDQVEEEFNEWLDRKGYDD
jgi:5-methylcytosine-specific restriction endonuclease McrA